MTKLSQIVAGLGVALISSFLLTGAFVLSIEEAKLGLRKLPPSDPEGGQTCEWPDGWRAVQAKPGDTLTSLAEAAGISVSKLKTSNCLEGEVQLGDTVYLPRSTSKSTSSCGPPENWILHTTSAGDDLDDLAFQFGISADELRQANCLADEISISTGERLYLPTLPTLTPSTADDASETTVASEDPLSEETQEATPVQ